MANDTIGLVLHLLGEGGESRVYAWDDDHVLRVAKGAWTPGDRRAVSDVIDRSAVPFAVPREVARGPGWTIEERVPGRSLDWWMGFLDGVDRRRALEAYARAALEVVDLAAEFDFFGEVCGTVRCATWPDFLRTKASAVVELSGPWLRSDVPAFDAVFERFLTDCDLVSDVTTARLVHGDYFPGNVVTAEDLSLAGVIDFGVLTLAGDPRMDLAGALWFVDCVDTFRPGDDDVVMGVVSPHVPAEVLDLYRRYYALFFSFAREDTRLYSWCVRHLASST